jgi:hypothetical protein
VCARKSGEEKGNELDAGAEAGLPITIRRSRLVILSMRASCALLNCLEPRHSTSPRSVYARGGYVIPLICFNLPPN